MTPSNRFRTQAARAATLVLLFSPAVAARPQALEGEAAPASPQALLATSDSIAPRVHFDEPGDGALWARGARWKASFDASGAVYYAGFGPRQPRNLPHALSPDVVTVGGAPLEFDRAASPALRGERVELDRGAFVEAYETDVDSIEQLFVFESLPRAGELVVEIPIASELEGRETSSGLEFRGEHGHLTYSRAVAIDAQGRRAAAPTKLVDGRIRITVDAGFLAAAEMPLVIDPVVSQFWLDSFTEVRRAPDMVWDPFHQVWTAVYEEVFSATDTDIVVKLLSPTGVLLVQNYVDFTGASWTKPRIANNGAAHVSLAVAERSSSSPKTVMGRIVQPNGTIVTMSSQFDIGGPVPGDKLTPDVGGDPRSIPGTNFCVTFSHLIGSNDSEIAYRMVTPAGIALGTEPALLPDAAVAPNTTPSISRSNGGTTWLVAWHRASSAFPVSDSILAARVRADGSVASAPFVVSSSVSAFFGAPSASSPLSSSERCAITFSSRLFFPLGSKPDVIVSALDGGTVLQTVNLTTLENSGFQSLDQIEPSVDSDGQHFLVVYSEPDPVFGGINAFASDLYLSGSQIGLAQTHVQLHPGLNLPQHVSQVAAMRSPTSFARRYGVIYEVRPGTDLFDVSAVLFDGVLGGTISAFCAGDGSIGNCPCGNNGINGNGCGNSFNSAGGRLAGSGIVSTVQDTFRLDATNLPPASSQVTFFQGTTASSAAAFGDGLRCATGTIVRIGTVLSSSGQASYGFGVAGSQPISAQGAVPSIGGTRYYQATYRNSVGFCTSATFNVTNGVAAQWAP